MRVYPHFLVTGSVLVPYRPNVLITRALIRLGPNYAKSMFQRDFNLLLPPLSIGVTRQKGIN